MAPPATNWASTPQRSTPSTCTSLIGWAHTPTPSDRSGTDAAPACGSTAWGGAAGRRARPAPTLAADGPGRASVHMRVEEARMGATESAPCPRLRSGAHPRPGHRCAHTRRAGSPAREARPLVRVAGRPASAVPRAAQGWPWPLVSSLYSSEVGFGDLRLLAVVPLGEPRPQLLPAARPCGWYPFSSTSVRPRTACADRAR